MKRRDLIKNLGALPLAGAFLPLNTPGAIIDRILEREAGPLSLGPNIYESIGVDPIINCRGTFTIIGGSIERPEVVAAMKAASGQFVQYDELAFGIGKRLAEITGAEWGMVSSGCAAGLKHVTAACVTGGNPEKLIRIPDLTGIEKNEVIIYPNPVRDELYFKRNIEGNYDVRISDTNGITLVEKNLAIQNPLIYLVFLQGYIFYQLITKPYINS